MEDENENTEVTVNVEHPSDVQVQAEAAVAIAEIEAETIEQRIEALAAATVALRGVADEMGALRVAFEDHVRNNESDFNVIKERLTLLEAGMGEMQAALAEEADAVETLLREEIREEIIGEAAVADETHAEAIETGEVPQAVPEEKPEGETQPEEHKRKRHFVSL
jgi:hypothetical protein